MATRAATVEAYIAALPKNAQKKLREMRAVVKSVAPKASEGIKWGMPSISHKRILVIYGAFSKHVGFYPTPSAIRAFSKELARYKSARGSVQFPYTDPLPKALIKRMVAFRLKEEKERDKKWMDRS